MSNNSIQINLLRMENSGPESVDNAISQGIDLDGSTIPAEMLMLYKQVMDKENARKRSGVKKSMRNRIVRSGSKHYDQQSLNKMLVDSGWDGLSKKEIQFFYN